MSPSLQQWESDPLFSAAEVVQDSADRMESIFRLLLHELSVAQRDNSSPKIVSSIDCHRRDLATILETTKWQLEDFQRAVSLSLAPEKSKRKDEVISRHTQLIRAIREHIGQVEKNLEDGSFGNPVRNNEWVNLNEEDKHGLALFLSGENPSEQSGFSDSRDNGLLRRFLDSATESRVNKNEIIGLETSNINGIGSYTSKELGSQQEIELIPELSRNQCGEEGSWDLEANESEPKNFFEESKLRRFRRSRVVRFFVHLWTVYVSRVARNYTKRLKDGEEQSVSPSAINASNDFQNWLWTCKARYQTLNHIQLDRHYVQLIALAICALLILGILVLRIA